MAESDDPEVSEESKLLYDLISDASLLTPVVLIGASALIPVPFLDDIVKKFLEKRLTRLIAAKEHREIPKDELENLLEDPPKGCFALGCVINAIIYPLKKILRKVFFFLEIKRAVDQSTTALARAWLFQLALRRTLWEPGAGEESAIKLREAIAESCASQGVKPLEAAIRHAFEGAKGTLNDFALKFTKKAKPDESEMTQALKILETEQKDELAGLTRRLNESLSEVSDGYLEKFAKNFQSTLAKPAVPPGQTVA